MSQTTTIRSIVFAMSFCTMYTMGYIGILMGSFFITIFTATLIFSMNYPEEYLNIVKNSKYIVEKMDILDDQIILSPCKQYYKYKGVHYDIAFPIFWVLNEHPETGPHNCNNCKNFGTFRGVFLMYCCNCAPYYYNNVGYGAINNGSELIDGNDIQNSAWYTYLKYRNLKLIGLPEELENIDFDQQGYEYKLKYDTDDDGNITTCYPDFVLNEEEDEEEEDEEQDFDMVDNDSHATENIY